MLNWSPASAGPPWPQPLLRGMALRGLTCEAVAAATGLSARTIRRYRRGGRPGSRGAAGLRRLFRWRGGQTPRVRLVGSMPAGYPGPGDRAVMALLRAAAAATWPGVGPSRRSPGHSRRMARHALRVRAEADA